MEQSSAVSRWRSKIKYLLRTFDFYQIIGWIPKQNQALIITEDFILGKKGNTDLCTFETVFTCHSKSWLGNLTGKDPTIIKSLGGK